MFGRSADKTKKRLEKQYARLLLEARDLQRAGKIPEFAKKTAEAEAVANRLAALDVGR
jgi:hypothetical protein